MRCLGHAGQGEFCGRLGGQPQPSKPCPLEPHALSALSALPALAPCPAVVCLGRWEDLQQLGLLLRQHVQHVQALDPYDESAGPNPAASCAPFQAVALCCLCAPLGLHVRSALPPPCH